MSDLTFDTLKAKTRLVRRAPTDIVDAEARLTARISSRVWQEALSFDDRTKPSPRNADRFATTDRILEQHLKTLCGMIIARDLPNLGAFLSGCNLPEPEAARVLGCVLYLAHRSDSAQFWWQYAGGAGDKPAAGCLYLLHLALDEHPLARLWCDQAGLPLHQEPVSDEYVDGRDMVTNLRILTLLRSQDPGVSAAATAVIAYVPDALDDVEEVDLPLPEPDFAARIEELTAVC